MSRVIQLNNGVEIPIIGLGLYKIKENMERAVCSALDCGYTAFDTAQMYNNEHILGDVISGSGVDRGKIFITSKINNENHGYMNAINTFNKSLVDLKMDYVDLLLIHWPGGDKDRCLDTWRALEKLYKDGHTRAIGVSNFKEHHLGWILEGCSVRPMVNQVERHPYFSQPELMKYCMELGIYLQAWSPLMRGNLDIAELLKMSDKYSKTVAQIILRWNIQRDVIVIPKSETASRISENIDIFDFELSDNDMGLIDSMNCGERMYKDPDDWIF